MPVYDAFWKLSTCRSYGMAEGPIPWTAIHLYGECREMDDDQFFEFEELILAMDRAYLKIRNKPADPEPNKPPASSGKGKPHKKPRGQR